MSIIKLNVLIAGGAGMTPFLSLFTVSAFSEYAKPVMELIGSSPFAPTKNS